MRTSPRVFLFFAAASVVFPGCYVDWSFPDDAAVVCSGCVDFDGRCNDGVTDPQCGTGGETCHTCGAGRTCGAGVCEVETPATDLALGESHSCAVFRNRTHCWGNLTGGRSGSSRGDLEPWLPHPVALDGDSPQVFSAAAFSCLIDPASQLHCWGGQTSLEVDTRMFGSRSYFEPTLTFVESGWTHVSTSDFFACGLRSGDLFCWGRSAEGQLGGDFSDRGPLLLDIGAEVFWAGVATGRQHTCAWSTPETGGAAFCWGVNTNGQLGRGNMSESETPDPVMGSGGFELLCGGDSHTCAIRSDGSLWCWGDNALGQLGLRDVAQTSEPERVAEGSHSDLACGPFYTCAIQDGVLACFGDNERGQLGDGTAGPGGPDSSAVVHPEGLRWADVEAGDGHTCAIDVGGMMYCWGRRTNAQTGQPHDSDPQLILTEVVPPEMP